MSAPHGPPVPALAGRRVAVVPGTLLLLAQHASRTDPAPRLRAVVASAVDWLTEGLAMDEPVTVLCADDAGERVARELLGTRPVVLGPDDAGGPVLAVADGSACRTVKAPGHLDSRAQGFDAGLGAALRSGDAEALAGLDAGLAEELWCRSAAVWHVLARYPAAARSAVEVDFDDAPWGVQYWVCRWVS